MALGTRRTPERAGALFSGQIIRKGVTVNNVLSTAGGVEVMTVAEVLTGLMVADCQDAQTWTTPSAAVLNAGIPGVEVGSYFEFTIVNYGDTTLTIGLGTGVTITVIATVDSVLTIATLTSKRFRLECTAISNQNTPGSTDAWVLWGLSTSTVVLS